MNEVQFKIEAVDTDSINTAETIRIEGPKTELLTLLQAGAAIVGGVVEQISHADGTVIYENPHPELN